MQKSNYSLIKFTCFISFVNFLFFYLPFFKFVFNNITVISISGFLLVISFFIVAFLANFFIFYLFLSISKFLGKLFLIITFIINSIAVYFINTYNIIIDESMISNILNTNYEESSSYFSIKLILYLIFLGILPSYFIFKAKVAKQSFNKTLKILGSSLFGLVILVIINANNILWIDKNSKTLGGLAMPWCYVVNIPLYYLHDYQKNKKEITLPDATITNTNKDVVVLVIGESARKKNFSLYGYEKNTNPLLSKIKNISTFNAVSCATYTTAGLKCILEHEKSNDLYEILPNYLYRNGVEVIWKTSNWGEPPVHIKNYFKRDDLKKDCIGEDCNYDEILIKDIKNDIKNSTKNKVLIVIHTSTSHGPSYNKKYPKKFEFFTPVCNSVELDNCSQSHLINAYDNTIIYTDYLLSNIIKSLDMIKEYNSTMIFVSDHGESLGEKNLYMHGLPMSIAPKEQYEIPFIVWVSNPNNKTKNIQDVSQNHVFHSVMKFLGITSSIYNENLSIYE